MRTYKSPMDIVKLDRTEAVYPIVLQMLKLLMITSDRECQCWCPDSQGFIVELEKTDDPSNLSPVWEASFLKLPFENVYYEDGFYVGIVILNNDFGLIWLVEDAPWIDGPIRTILEENCDPSFAGNGGSYSEVIT